ncbi:MAG: cytochrome c family protein [Albidovulum sp.]|nr:cytochrome c family protein [Albidovulum sp.]MDE0304297.1 cytochrome c family protein [Albidovulum sp.]MDE0531583.1 cytochrome c family protein [Albidovulum sp.]
MLDTMTLTKAVGALCGALLILLLGQWATASLYHVGGGHGDEHHGAAELLAIESGAGAEDEPQVEETVDIAMLVAEADAGKGKKVFAKCKACHKLEDGANGTGPHLFQIVGREVASVSEFDYSSSLQEMGGVWDANALDEFVMKPKDFVPGTKMSFAGLKKIKDRANLIAYLKSLQ